VRLARVLPALAVAVVVGAALATAATSLQQDFAAYRVAGAAQRAGLDPYVNHLGSIRQEPSEGSLDLPRRLRWAEPSSVNATAAPGLWDGLALFRHSRFLYPPLVADLFRPLAALRYQTAKLLFTLAMLGAWLGAAALVGGPRERAVVLVASALFFPLYRHFERGQIDLLLLLLLAGALLVNSIEKLIALGALPAIVDPVWNTSALLDDSSRVAAGSLTYPPGAPLAYRYQTTAFKSERCTTSFPL